MSLKKFAYYFSKFTLFDEFLGFIYWALSIYGIFLIVENTKSQMVMIAILCIYVMTVVILYIFLIKKIKLYFKGVKGNGS